MKIANLTTKKFFPVNSRVLILLSAMSFSLFTQAQLVNITSGTTVTVVSGTNMVVAGGISFQAGTSAMNNSGTVKLTGNWTNDGNGLTGGTGTVECNGASIQNLTGTNSTSFYNLTVNNAAGVTLGKDQSVSSTLTFASGSGSLTTGSNKLTVTSTGNGIAGANSSSYVNGNLQKDFGVNAGQQSFIFEMGDAVYAPSTLDIRNVNGSDVSVAGYTTPTDANESIGGGSGINQSAKADRYWIMTKSGGAFDDYDLTLDFTNCSPAGNTANYVMRKFDPTSWSATTATVTGTTIKATGLTGFSDFETGEPNAALAIGSCSQTNVSCNGGSNGTATAGTPSNSVGTVHYLWSNGQSTAMATALSATSYTLTVTDNFYSTTCSVTITEPALLTAAVGSNSPICVNDVLNLSSTIGGGTSGYNYSWSGPMGFSSTLANPSFTATSSSYTGTYSVSVTDANNCPATAITNVTVNDCVTTLNLNLFLEGYYVGSGFMRPAIKNEGQSFDPTLTDSIFVYLHNTTSPYASTDTAVAFLKTNGTATATFSPNLYLISATRYIEIRHRNTIQSWSASPVMFTTTTSYDFTSGSGQAYGNNLIQVDNSLNLFGLYSGNLNQDQNIDLIDFPILDFGINNGLYGYYRSDLNGDGNTDLLDFPVLDSNINSGVFSRHP